MRVVRDASASETGLLLLPVTAGISLGSMMTGRIVTRTGRTMIFPSVGLIVVTLLLVGFDLTIGTLSLGQLSVLLGVTSFFMGTVMGVVQVTVQGAAGARMLGAGAASVQLSRSVGSAIGTALLGTVLFATLAAADPEAGRMFGAILDRGTAALDGLEPLRRTVLEGEIATAFRAGFLILPIFTAIGAVLAWLQPARRV
jgi:hypothetical protein